MQQFLARLFPLIATLLLAAPRGAAQCAPPDGLDGGPCCSQAQLLVPRPKFTQGSLGICWRDCNIDSVTPYTAIWSAPTPTLWSGGSAASPPCGWFQTRLRLVAGATTLWSGAIQLTYARTWVETKPTGVQIHVWRFLANGDMTPSAAAGPIPCPVPSCVPAFNNRARFTGYVDYAFDCSAGTWENAWMLTHACDAIDHAPGFPRAGAFHPDRTYSFVGPSLGFVPSSLIPGEVGGTGFESIRGWRVPVPGTTGSVDCEHEERVANAMLAPQAQFCLCSPGPGQFQNAQLFVSGACGTTISSAAGALGFLSMGIGSWTNPAAYPGTERLRWNSGEYVWNDPCIGTATNETCFGVTTLGGFPANQYLSTGVAGPLPTTFIDQASSKLLPAGTPVRNVPYLSDRVFNLNLP